MNRIVLSSILVFTLVFSARIADADHWRTHQSSNPTTHYLIQSHEYLMPPMAQFCQMGVSTACSSLQEVRSQLEIIVSKDVSCADGDKSACRYLQEFAQSVQQAQNDYVRQNRTVRPNPSTATGPSAGQILSEANDIQHGTGMGLLDSNPNAPLVNSIHERQIVTTPNNNRYQVDGHGNYIWINENGETYIDSDNPLLNPNIGHGSGNWQEGNQ